MKKILFILMVLVLAFALVGCSGGQKSAEEALKIFEKDGWFTLLMKTPDLEFDSYKAKEGMFASKDMAVVSYMIFGSEEDIKKFKKDSPEGFGVTMKVKGNAVGVFSGLSDEEVKKYSDKLGL